MKRTKAELEKAEKMLDAIRDAQDAFWNTLKDFENAFDVELDSSDNFNDTTVEDLLADS